MMLQEQREREVKSLPPSQNGAIPGAPSAAELKALIVSMTDKIKNLQIQSAQQKKENDNLRKDNSDLTTSKAKLEGELETAKKLNTTQAADIKEKKNQLDTLTKELNDKKDECTKLSNKIKDLQRDGDGWGTFMGEAYKLLQNGDQLLDNWSSQSAGK